MPGERGQPLCYPARAVRRSSTRLQLALVFMGVLAAIAVTGGSAADFESDTGPCTETPGNGALLRCTTAYIGEEYEVEIQSEEGSGCEPYDWFEVVNSALPPGLTMTRDGVISGVPTGPPGLARFWLWDHDLTAAQGGPSWCQREDRSEREFSIPVEPSLAIDTDSLEAATIGQPYSETFTAKWVVSLNPPTGPAAPATWSLQSGALPPGLALSANGALAGTPTAEGSYSFVVKAQNGTPVDTEAYTLAVRQLLSVTSPLGQRALAEVGVPFSKTFTATGGSGSYTWAVGSGALPAGVTLDKTKGTISGAPQSAGNFAFAMTATDSEGRDETANVALTVVPRLAIRTLRLTPARVGRAYELTLRTAGGAGPFTWKVVKGKLPVGVRFDRSRGAFVGTPHRAGTFRLTVEATDAFGAKARKSLVLRVAG